MTVMDESGPLPVGRGARSSAVGLNGLAAIVAIATLAALYLAPMILVPLGIDRTPAAMGGSLMAAGALFIALGAIIGFRRLGMGGAIMLIGVLFWLAGCLEFQSFGWLLAAPAVFGFLGALTGMIASDRNIAATDSRLVFRQTALTRITHWVWVIALFFMVESGLQIFDARPNLYIGHQSGFGFENSILDIYAVNTPNGPRGQTKLFGHVFDTTGVLGMSGSAERPNFIAFPGWATIPSYRDLATGRVVHFFFAWILVGTLLIWLIQALLSGHLWRDIILRPRDIRDLPRDIVNHARFRFTHGRSYAPLQKLAYFGVFIILFPLIIATGITMSPGMDTAAPWLLDLFGGRQTARTIHFFTMAAFVLFFLFHVVMVILANPINELRSMITGYYRTVPERDSRTEER